MILKLLSFLLMVGLTSPHANDMDDFSDPLESFEDTNELDSGFDPESEFANQEVGDELDDISPPPMGMRDHMAHSAQNAPMMQRDAIHNAQTPTKKKNDITTMKPKKPASKYIERIQKIMKAKLIKDKSDRVYEKELKHEKLPGRSLDIDTLQKTIAELQQSLEELPKVLLEFFNAEAAHAQEVAKDPLQKKDALDELDQQKAKFDEFMRTLGSQVGILQEASRRFEGIDVEIPKQIEDHIASMSAYILTALRDLDGIISGKEHNEHYKHLHDVLHGIHFAGAFGSAHEELFHRTDEDVDDYSGTTKPHTVTYSHRLDPTHDEKIGELQKLINEARCKDPFTKKIIITSPSDVVPQKIAGCVSYMLGKARLRKFFNQLPACQGLDRNLSDKKLQMCHDDLNKAESNTTAVINQMISELKELKNRLTSGPKKDPVKEKAKNPLGALIKGMKSPITNRPTY